MLIFTIVPKHDSLEALAEDNANKDLSIVELWHKYNKYECLNITM